MAVHFNETGDHYEVAAAAARNFPEGDWVVALWTRVDNNVGSAYKYALSNGGWTENGSVNIYLNESNVTDANKFRVKIIDDIGASVVLDSSSAPGADGKDRLLILQRDASLERIELWFCEYGSDPVLEATVDAQSLGASTGPRNLWIGGRADASTDRFFGGVLGEVFRGDFALSEGQIKALGGGLAPWALGRDLTFYHPLSDARSVQRDLFGQNDASATDPGIAAAHFPLPIRPGTAPKWTPPEPPPGDDLLVDLSNVSTAALPGSGWDDSQGTVYLEDGNGNKRAVSWSPEGFTVAENGAVLEQYPPVWNDPPHTPATTYYVDATKGNDSYNGTSEATAWKTIAKVKSTSFSPGDRILFKAGETWLGDYLQVASGSVGNVIYYGAYGEGARPVIDRNATGRSSIYAIRASNVWVDGLDARNSTVAAILIEGNTCSNITFTDCIARDMTKLENKAFGISVAYSNNVRFKECLVYNCDTTGFMYLGWRTTGRHFNCVIADCTAHDNGLSSNPIQDRSEQFTLQGPWDSGVIYGSTFYESPPGKSLTYYDREGSESAQVRVFNNSFTGGADKYGWSCYLFKSAVRNYRNVVVAESHRMAIDSGQMNGRTQTQYTHHNLLVGGYVSGILYSEPGENEVSGGNHNSHTWNNTIDNSSTNEPGWGYGALTYGDGATPNPAGGSHRAKNNLITNSGTWFVVMKADFSVKEFDYNYYYAAVKSSPWSYLSTDKSWSEWQGLGFDVNGSEGDDPLYGNPVGWWSNFDYNLGASSPARGAGTDVVYDMTDPNSWIGINYVPHATSPDAGAYQYLSGKMLKFSKYFLGLRCKNGTAKRFKLWKSTKEESELRDLT